MVVKLQTRKGRVYASQIEDCFPLISRCHEDHSGIGEERWPESWPTVSSAILVASIMAAEIAEMIASGRRVILQQCHEASRASQRRGDIGANISSKGCSARVTQVTSRRVPLNIYRSNTTMIFYWGKRDHCGCHEVALGAVG